MKLIRRAADDEESRGWPAYLFWGRMRTSTFVLIVAFLATWWVYETYSPEPAASVPETQVVPPGFVPDPGYTWVPRTNVQTAEPTTESPTTTTTTSPVTTTPETTTATPTPTGPTDTTPTDGPPTTLPTAPGQPPTTPAVPVPLTPGQLPETTAENRSGRPPPTTSAAVPVPANGDRP